MGGMLAATFLAVFFVPLFFRFFEEFKLSEKRSREELFDEVKQRQRQTKVPQTPGHPPVASHGDDDHA
jgi:hypothetical protein